MVNLEKINAFYKNRRVFITGHTGFKGSWLLYLLHRAGAKVKGYALEPDTSPSLYQYVAEASKPVSVIADINDAGRLEKEMLDFAPEVIFHLAAQSIVRKSYQEPLATFSTNAMGTANVLQALVKMKHKCSAVFITTDKVYDNKEIDYAYNEDDALGGHDPYSSSKACAEIIIQSYAKSFFPNESFLSHQTAIASVRSGNVIGGGDWAVDRLLPDIIRALVNKQDILIRNPNSIRPWQHVLDPLTGYLHLGMGLFNSAGKYPGAYNFGPDHKDNLKVDEVAKVAVEMWGEGTIINHREIGAPHEAGILKLNINKAKEQLGWHQALSTKKAVERTINWYKKFYAGEKSPVDLMESDILFYHESLSA